STPRPEGGINRTARKIGLGWIRPCQSMVCALGSTLGEISLSVRAVRACAPDQLEEDNRMSIKAAVSGTAVRSRPMSREEKRVILAYSLGTVFEWYDFYLYGSLAAIIGAQFFSQYPEATRNIFALLAFAAGFLVRPFGALVFGRLGDLVGRKYTFLITI